MLMQLCSQRSILSSKVLLSSFRRSFYNIDSVSALLPLFRVSNVTVKYRFCTRFYVGVNNNMSILSNDNASMHLRARRPYQVVVAATRNMGIGKDGKLPWNLPSDLKFFKQLTMSTSDPGKRNAVVMGRKTWESISPLYRPLPGRLNVVLTRSGGFNIASLENVEICGSIHLALELLAEPPYCSSIEKVFVIGGGQILREALNAPECDAIHITKIETSIECDTFIPAIDLSLFQQRLDKFAYPSLVQEVFSSSIQKDDRTGTSTSRFYRRKASVRGMEILTETPLTGNYRTIRSHIYKYCFTRANPTYTNFSALACSVEKRMLWSCMFSPL